MATRPMVPLVRFTKVLAQSRIRPRLDPLGTSVVHLRVWPNDLDGNRHLTNARYLRMMDIGRWDLILRCGLLKDLVKRRWFPVIASSTIRFRRELAPFQTYEVHTRIVTWDERGFYIEQRFKRDGNVHAVGLVYGMFRGPEGTVPPQRAVDLVDAARTPPPMPAWIDLWRRSQQALSKEMRAEQALPDQEAPQRVHVSQ